MKTRILASTLMTLLLAAGGAVQAGPLDLFDACLNINGNIHGIANGCFRTETGDPAPDAPGNVTDELETNLLASNSGLGSVSITLSEVGDFFIGLFADGEIDEETNTFFNEDFGSNGVLAAGQSFEVDEPGYGEGGYLGDIFENFALGALDNGFMEESFTETSGNAPEDISLGLGWNFSLTAGQTAVVSFLLSDIAPNTGFWLSHSDPDSEFTFFFSSTLEISGGETEPPPVPVPEPGTLVLIGAGLLGTAISRRRQARSI